MKIQIRPGLEIGEKPFIIAEVGSNWKSQDDCLKSIVAAARTGADAVKFQAFTPDALYGTGGTGELMPKGALGILPTEWLPSLKRAADANGIEFMCTAFSPELYEAVDPFVSIHKVASAECTHLRILEKVRALGKPLILSTGAHGRTDILMSLGELKGVPTVLMYCVADYPAQEVDLRVIMAMREQFGCLVGYSDHSTDVLEIPKAAVHTYDAKVIEKHFTAIPEAETPDRPHSITPEQFTRMVKSIRGTLEVPAIAYAPSERGMLLRHNRRIIARRDIPSGTPLVEGEHFGIYRSLMDDTHAFHPFMAPRLQGVVTKREIKAGEGIGPGDV